MTHSIRFAAFSRVAVLVLLLGGILSLNPQAGYSDAMPKGKKARAVKVARGRAKVIKTAKKSHSARKVRKAKLETKLQYPLPGGGGEEHDDWFTRRRAWPNEEIDPNSYTNALAQASKMPVLRNAPGKHSVSASLTWTALGPYSIDGRITSIATHPTDANISYVGAAAGGLWKTTDHGVSWRCLTDTFGTLSIGCVTIDPVDPQTVYMGQGECNASADSYPGNGLWKSTDGGSSWTYLGFAKSQYIAKLIVDPRQHTTLYLCVPGSNTSSDSNRGIYKSIDGGLTWTRSLIVRASTTKTSTTMGFYDLVMNPIDPTQLAAISWDKTRGDFRNYGPQTGIWLTKDGGDSWSRLDTMDNGLPNGRKENLLSRGALLWSADGQRTYLYAAYSHADTNEVTHYVTDANFKGLYRSTDNGATWKKILDSTARIPMGGVQGKDSADIFNKQGTYDIYLAGNPHNPREVYLGGIDVMMSLDTGDTWKNITNSYSEYYVKGSRDQHSDQHGLAFTADPSGTDMLVVSDGGVFHTTNYGTNWKQVTGLSITMFYGIEPWKGGMKDLPAKIGPDDLKLFGGTQDNGTVGYGLTADTNYIWINHGDGGYAQSHPTDPDKLVTSLQLGGLFARNTRDSLAHPLPRVARDTTHDARPRWHTLTNRLLYGADRLTDTTESCAFIAPVLLDDERTNDLYTARTHVYHAVLDWNDLENTKWYRWSPILAGNTTNSSKWYQGDLETIAIGPRDNAGHPMLWAGGFTQASPYSAVWRTVVDPTRQDTVAPKWIAVNKGLPGTTISCIVPDRTDSMRAYIATMGSAVTDSQHVFRTTDGGKTWKNISSNLPHSPVSALVIDTAAEDGDPLKRDQVLIAATDVGVYVTTNGGLNWSALGEGMPHIIVSDLKIYRNMLVAATHGRGLYAMDISSLNGTQRSVGASAPTDNSLSIYPNPAQAGTAIRLTWNSAVERSAIHARLIRESDGHAFDYPLDRMQDGTSSFTFGNELVPSAYILQVISDSQILAQGRIAVIR